MENKEVQYGGIHFEYDDAGRVTHIININYRGGVTHTYLRYNEQGRLSLVKENGYKISYEYDDQGRLICEHHVGDHGNLHEIAVVKYEYEDDHVTKLTKDRSGRHILKYDRENRIICDERIYPDGSGCMTKYEFNNDTNMVRSFVYVAKEGVYNYVASSEYPMLPTMNTDDARKLYYPEED